MLTASCRLMFPTAVSETRNFWNAAKGANLRMTFFGVVMAYASDEGYHGIGSGGLTVWPSCSTEVMSGKWCSTRFFRTARACLRTALAGADFINKRMDVH